MIRVGVPRALLYYQYYPMWKTFFESLGAEVVVSPTTTQAMVSSGASRVVAETCLPAKVFLGHTLTLADKCDFMFIPVVRSVRKKTYNCSKFLGLPDMCRAVIPESPPILEPEIDVNRGQRDLYLAIYRLGRRFTWNPRKVKQAAQAAWQSHLDYLNLMSSDKLTPPQAIERLTGTSQPSLFGDRLEIPLNPFRVNLQDEPPFTKGDIPHSPVSHSLEKRNGQKKNSEMSGTHKATIAVIGHSYILYDEHISHRIIHRLEQAGAKVLTPDMLMRQELEAAVIKITGRVYWTQEEEVVGAGVHYLESAVDGIIGLTTFGCGPDSLMMDVVRRQATKLKNVPFMSLTLDEHTAEGGLITRLEAFLDMLQRKKRGKSEVCASA
ncbi:MAG: hypothetical protein HYX79_01365 [Chloroflexi bacterium]|nr:hypothetical protein [Chloroflexota bacterium]